MFVACCFMEVGLLEASPFYKQKHLHKSFGSGISGRKDGCSEGSWVAV